MTLVEVRIRLWLLMEGQHAEGTREGDKGVQHRPGHEPEANRGLHGGLQRLEGGQALSQEGA